MRFLARLLLIWTPAFIKARACSETSADLNALAVAALEEAGPDALSAYSRAAVQAGKRCGRRLRSELRLGSQFADAELAWRLVVKFSGMKASVRREKSRSVFIHTKCPVYDAGGAAMCRSFCLPFVEGLTEVICPSCAAEIVKPADETAACSKALVHRGENDAG